MGVVELDVGLWMRFLPESPGYKMVKQSKLAQVARAVRLRASNVFTPRIFPLPL